MIPASSRSPDRGENIPRFVVIQTFGLVKQAPRGPILSVFTALSALIDFVASGNHFFLAFSVLWVGATAYFNNVSVAWMRAFTIDGEGCRGEKPCRSRCISMQTLDSSPCLHTVPSFGNFASGRFVKSCLKQMLRDWILTSLQIDTCPLLLLFKGLLLDAL